MDDERGPKGRVIDAGQVTFAGTGDLTVADTKRRSLLETLQYLVDEFTKTAPTLPQPGGGIILDAARRGLRKGQGRSGAALSHTEKLARATAMKEAPALLKRFRAEARAVGQHNPLRWAREETAKVLRQRMTELGAKPPHVKTIMKWKF
jgi:hypothetical protein